MFKDSVWAFENEIPKRDKLNRNLTVDVAVIGGGMAGILTAQRLSSVGKNVVVLEARRIASGQTKNTTAKISAQHGLIYANMIASIGEKKAKIYADANMRAVEWYKKYIKENNINCSLEEKDAYIYTDTDISKLKTEYKAYKKIGLSASLVDKIPFLKRAKGGLVLHNQAQFNPLKFIKAVSANLKIYENTPVKKVEDHRVICEDFTVEAKHIVFACHYPFVNFPAFYFARIYQQRSYIIALENACQVDGMYIGAEKDDFSFRNYKDLLLLGGAQHRTGENSEGRRYETLLKKAEELFPKSKAVAMWSAQDCITADGISYIGRFSAGKPDWYVATGFLKWGMTTSAVAAELITDLILDRKNEAQEVFSPSRFSLKSAKGIANETVHSAKGLIKQIVYIPKDKINEIKVGQAGIVMLEGRRVGVYRENEKKYHCVSLKCPHLGCRLEWNPDERSWDCPCHGSRFNFKGELIDNPAQSNIHLK